MDELIEHTPAKIAWERKLTLRMKGPTENDANTKGAFDGEEGAFLLTRKRRCSETHLSGLGLHC